MMIADPPEMRAFARDLDDFVSELRQRQQRLEDGLARLGATWKDERYQSFSKSVTTAAVQLQAFYNVCRRYSEFLQSKANAVDRFLSGG